MYKLPEALRPQLGRPLGPVLPPREAVQNAGRVRVICTVGDATTAAFLEEGVLPRVMVVDNRTKRGAFAGPIRDRVPPGTPVVQVKNDAATITEDLWQAIAGAMARREPTLIEVQGEEDLATLPAVLLAPAGSVVAYGQPDQGIVLLNVDDAARERVRALLKQMEGP
ncbi:MAG TPA: DUF359 domain-containing protein [Candidatus Thermoplasmatota archaeon]|jgi:hypothetical protein|nr:DUF359 domain-containing protein [Candidatus Thermoplasmatota archaeon]